MGLWDFVLVARKMLERLDEGRPMTGDEYNFHACILVATACVYMNRLQASHWIETEELRTVCFLCLVLAMKYHTDEFVTMSFFLEYSHGMNSEAFMDSEVKLLKILKFNLFVQEEEINEALKLIISVSE